MANGFIKIDRSLLDWAYYEDDRCVRLLLHLILCANFKPGKFKGIDIKPGQFVTSTVKLSGQLGWTRSTLRRTLERLTESGEIVTKADNKRTLVTLIKWEQFQVMETKAASKRPASGQQVSQQTATIEEGKKERSKEVTTSVVTTRLSFDQFRERCLAIHRESKILSDPESKAFFDYCTEGHPETKPRYADKDKFDIAKLMQCWNRKNIDRPTNGFNGSTNGKTYDGWTVERIEAWMNDYKANNGGSYPNSGTANVPKAYKLWKEWI